MFPLLVLLLFGNCMLLVQHSIAETGECVRASTLELQHALHFRQRGKPSKGPSVVGLMSASSVYAGEVQGPTTCFSEL